MEKRVGLLTSNFRLYHDLVAHLKEREVPFLSLSFDQPIPREVTVVLTSPEEVEAVAFEPVVAVEEVSAAVVQAQQYLRGKAVFDELVVGVDPGPRPGVAVLGDGEVLQTHVAPSPEGVRPILEEVLQSYEARVLHLRIGHGDPTNRNRILNAVAPLSLPTEIVDERGTTHKDRSRDTTRDIASAVAIARESGSAAAPQYDVFPTPGELRNIQRESRIRSGGQLTISKGLARRVARGEMTLGEAIEAQAQRPRRK